MSFLSGFNGLVNKASWRARVSQLDTNVRCSEICFKESMATRELENKGNKKSNSISRVFSIGPNYSKSRAIIYLPGSYLRPIFSYLKFYFVYVKSCFWMDKITQSIQLLNIYKWVNHDLFSFHSKFHFDKIVSRRKSNAKATQEQPIFTKESITINLSPKFHFLYAQSRPCEDQITRNDIR